MRRRVHGLQGRPVGESMFRPDSVRVVDLPRGPGPLARDVEAREAVALTLHERRLCAGKPLLEGAIRHLRAELEATRSETDPRYAKNRRRYVRELRAALRDVYERCRVSG